MKRTIVLAFMGQIANCSTGKIREIRSFLKMETNQFNPYRKRLIRKGIINGEEYGYVLFTLPLFEKFVLENYIEASNIVTVL